MALTASPPAADRLDPSRLTGVTSRTFLPWSNDAALRIILANAAALGLVITSWYLTSGETDLGTQTNWLKLGIAGLVASGVANGLWLLRGRRAVGLARVALLAEFENGAIEVPLPHAAGSQVLVAGSHVLVAGDRMTRFHTVSCDLVTGKVVTAADRTDHIAAGRRPCELCRP